MSRAVQVKVVRREGEDFEHMLKRFKKAYQEQGILADIRKNEFYRSPSLKKREKRENAEKRRRKEARKHGNFSRFDN